MLTFLKKSAVLLVAATALVVATASVSVADDWIAVKLRGKVFAFNGEGWDQLQRGSVVSDDRIIRTIRSGRVQFQRGEETIDVGGDTQIRIFDKAGQKYTTVQQHYGAVAIEAERKNVQHFAVQTPYLAAVVKGTRFEVRVDGEAASVDVDRGRVEVRDTVHDLMVDVNPGQSASVGEDEFLNVDGRGKIEDIRTFSGKVVDVAQLQAAANENAGAGNNNSGGNGRGNSGNAGANGAASSGNANTGPGNNNNAAGNGNSNAGGNGNGNSAADDGPGNSNSAGNSGNSNAGGNGKGKGNS